MVTALRIDLDIQAEIEAAAQARGIGASTLMRRIIEDWVAAHHSSAAPVTSGRRSSASVNPLRVHRSWSGRAPGVVG
jgi:hypothetical protein